jgi:hypothetical protein
MFTTHLVTLSITSRTAFSSNEDKRIRRRSQVTIGLIYFPCFPFEISLDMSLRLAKIAIVCFGSWGILPAKRAHETFLSNESARLTEEFHDFHLLVRLMDQETNHLTNYGLNLPLVVDWNGCSPGFLRVFAYRGLGYSEKSCDLRFSHSVFF